MSNIIESPNIITLEGATSRFALKYLLQMLWNCVYWMEKYPLWRMKEVKIISARWEPKLPIKIYWCSHLFISQGCRFCSPYARFCFLKDSSAIHSSFVYWRSQPTVFSWQKQHFVSGFIYEVIQHSRHISMIKTHTSVVTGADADRNLSWCLEICQLSRVTGFTFSHRLIVCKQAVSIWVDHFHFIKIVLNKLFKLFYTNV